jgi:dCMP deaminase
MTLCPAHNRNAASGIDPAIDWDARWMELARHLTQWSMDRSRKTSAVIVDRDHNILVSIGVNEFSPGVETNVESRHQRPDKYKWTEHAERNAIFDAAAKGISTLGCHIYLPWYPCAECARAISRARIAEVIAIEPDWNDPTYAAEFAIARTVLEKGRVKVRFMNGEAPKQDGQKAA